MKPAGMEQQRLTQFEYSHAFEWLETNGLGGWAASTVSGAHSRRYHGLLIAAEDPRTNPMVLVSKLEESVVTESDRYQLSCNQYPTTTYPAGHQHLHGFDRDLFPCFTFRMDDFEIRKTIAAVHGENTVLVLYEVTRAPGPFLFELLPMYSARDVHQMSRANDAINRQFVFSGGVLRLKNYSSTPEIFISVPGSSFQEEQHWYYNLSYSAEKDRGMDHAEDLYGHGKFSLTLRSGSQLGVILSTRDPHRRNAFALFRKEERRRKKRIADAGSEQLRRLALAADQFVLVRDGGGIIAGYPWLGERSRDTLIAVSGLCFATGRVKEGRTILQRFIGYLNDGAISGGNTEFNAIDVALWYFVAVYHYYMFTRDARFVRSLLPMLGNIVDRYVKGAIPGIRVDDDGMLTGDIPGVPLTWMDAMNANGPVTRRAGKAVEVNALWYNALRILEFLVIETGKRKDYEYHGTLAARIMENFMKVFWNENGGYLFDYVDGAYRNADIRPNQLLAITLPFPLLPRNRAERLLHIVERELLTAKGLRSLSPSAPHYVPHYEGAQWTRDEASHQGTAWSHLLGWYVDALVLLREDKGRNEAWELLSAFLSHLDEGCVGTLSELFDGAPPHAHRGCIAYACTVAEVLRVATEHGLLHHREKQVAPIRISF